MSDPFPTDRIVTGSLCYVLRQDADGGRSVLMLRRERPPQQGMWSAPGGKLHMGEAPDECVIREVHEETGLWIARPELRAVVTVFDAAWPIHWLLFIYRTSHFSGDLRPGEEGELRWIALDALGSYPRPYADCQYWAHVLADEPAVWRGKFIYDTPHTLVDEIRYDVSASE